MLDKSVIVDPTLLPKRKPGKKDIENLKKWVSVGGLTWDFAKASVGVSVRDSARATVAYMSSFFKIKYQYNFTPLVKLWERGLIPIYDGEEWLLVSGGEVVWKGKIPILR